MSKIGKGVLENLTQAMYDDSRIVYREYLQNSCDQIDVAKEKNSFPDEKLEVIITIDEKKRNIFIRDNANGISVKEVEKRLGDVADSEKVQGQNKGFRGIGRLGGIGYCNELRFITSFRGEKVETTMIWNAKRLQEIFWDSKNHMSAEAILDEIITYEAKEADEDAHYFEVQMLGITEGNDKLLDYKDIKQYISEVAPVDFKKTFLFRSEIYNFVKNNEEVPPIHCYDIGIRRQDGELNYISKEYPNAIYKMVGKEKKRLDDIKGVQTDIIYDTKGNPIAWIWYAISSFKGAINDMGNPYKGLRLRQFNIQIGDKTTLVKFFKETRGNSYFMGEIHTISPKLRPNARRDYFNETIEVRELEDALREYFKGLSKLYKAGSEINSSYNNIDKAEKLQEKYNESLQTRFISPENKNQMEAELAKAKEKAKEGLATIKKYNTKANKDKNSAVAKIVNAIKSDKNVDMDKVEEAFGSYKTINETNTSTETENPTTTTNATKATHPSKEYTTTQPTEKKEKTKYLTEELSCYDKKTRKIISRIYDVIYKNMIAEEATDLVRKIHEELKNNR